MNFDLWDPFHWISAQYPSSDSIQVSQHQDPPTKWVVSKTIWLFLLLTLVMQRQEMYTHSKGVSYINYLTGFIIDFSHKDRIQPSRYSPSASTSLIMSCSSASVGFWPSDLITVPNSFVVIDPSPSLSNNLNASLNSKTKLGILC